MKQLNQSRASGILLHPTSLPGPYGMGEMGAEAEAFVASLSRMGQQLWQILPLGPTGFGDSPYQSLSTFAGNHLLISLDRLVEADLLDRADLADYPLFNPHQIDFGTLIETKQPLLVRVCRDFQQRASQEQRQALETFRDENRDWLDDYALFVALKQKHNGAPWTAWPKPLRLREPAALANAKVELAASVRTTAILQFLFFEQWFQLKTFCAQKRVRIIGDIPIFVASDSVDVWSNPELFQLDEEGQPTVVAGVPPDYFSETGQLWGNPLYCWDRMAADDYAWWKKRLANTLRLVDLVRIDHFRGFDSYWEIPAGEETAINGRWVPGPGMKLFDAIRTTFGAPPVIAEDLGIITDEVTALREETGFPGMKVLHFIVGNDPLESDDRPENFPTNSVCYTGTHDNDTTVGWFAEAGDNKQVILDNLGSNGAAIHWDLMRAAWLGASNTAIAPLQDLLGLGSESRLNLPGRPRGNWQWRFCADQLTAELEEKLKQLTIAARRIRVGDEAPTHVGTECES